MCAHLELAGSVGTAGSWGATPAAQPPCGAGHRGVPGETGPGQSTTQRRLASTGKLVGSWWVKEADADGAEWGGPRADGTVRCCALLIGGCLCGYRQYIDGAGGGDCLSVYVSTWREVDVLCGEERPRGLRPFRAITVTFRSKVRRKYSMQE